MQRFYGFRACEKPLQSRMVVILILLMVSTGANTLSAQTRRALSDEKQLDKIPFDGRSAYRILKQVCDLGPRITGSKAMLQQQDLLIKHFEALGAKVKKQIFTVPHPQTRDDTQVMNLIVQWNPESKKRLLICCHYDTRPFPDKDPVNPKGLFLGANDGASGVALLHELGKLMPDLKCTYGVDFVFFDAEEFIYDSRRDSLFVGSEFFSKDYKENPPEYQYVSGVLIDMIGDSNLELYYEKHSMQFAPILTRGIWNTARKLGVREFIPRQRHSVRDDHLPLNQIARIPTTDIIDFDFPSVKSRKSYWHTREDTADKCSALSLAKVGWVLHQWLKEVK